MSDTRLITCPACHATNRVPADKIAQGLKPLCGKCKQPLPLESSHPAEPITITDATFAEQVEQSPVPVLVDMWAPWCGPCRMIAPVVEEVAAEMAGRIRVAKMNVDQNPVTSDRFRISSIPALLIFKNGREFDRMVGTQAKGEIVRRLQRAMS